MCWYTIDIRSSLLCEPTSPRVAIATSCDAISSHNRVESKLTNIRESTFCAWRHVICCRSFTNVTLLFDYFQSLYNYIMNELTLNCGFVYVAYNGVFHRIPMICRHDKVVRQWRSRATSRHSVVIHVKHLVMDTLLSLISKEKVHNVRWR